MRDEPLGSQEPGALGLPTAQSCRERAEIRQGRLSPGNPGLGRGEVNGTAQRGCSKAG